MASRTDYSWCAVACRSCEKWFLDTPLSMQIGEARQRTSARYYVIKNSAGSFLITYLGIYVPYVGSIGQNPCDRWSRDKLATEELWD